MRLECPDCSLPLFRSDIAAGPLWECSKCRGVATSVAVFRQAIHTPIADRIWNGFSTAVRGMRHCPACFRIMHSGPPQSGHLKTLDACLHCQLIWFDAGELGLLPSSVPLPVGHELPPPKPDFAAIRRARFEEAERTPIKAVPEPVHLDADSPERGWQFLICLLGLPVEENASTERRFFWVTWLLLAGMVAAMGLTWANLDTVVKAWGFIPSEALRHGGLTLLTSFFLHAGFWHLVANGYFLLVFGDNVEDHLGTWSFLLLILVATVVGHACHAAFAKDPHIPCVGASGGISGVIAFYALAFPGARIRLLLRFFFIGISARTAFVLWLLAQGLGAWLQLSGYGHVSYLAHLGGAATGVAWWYLFGARHETEPALTNRCPSP